MEHDKAAALRRAAIVLSSLPDATAGRLLAGLGPDQQRAVRMAISGLSDVDPLECRRALDGFATSIRRGRSSLAGQNDAAEIVLSKVALQHPDARPGTSPGNATAPPHGVAPLAFLSDVDDDALAQQVCDEHPQTIAIILASIAPAQAARILSKLAVTTRSEAMRRLAKLDVPPAELVSDIGSQLKNKLLASGAQFGSPPPRFAATTSGQMTAGQATLQAILAEMPTAPTATFNPIPPIPGHRDLGTVRGAADAASLPSARDAGGHDVAGPEKPSIRLAEETWPVPESTDAIHARLVTTAPARLREALAVVPARQALLALCGLPTATAEKVLGSLPRRQARQIRQQIADLGTLELREIDRAKDAVASAINQLEKKSSPGRPAALTQKSSRESKLVVAA